MAVLFIILILALALSKDTIKAISNKAKSNRQQTEQSNQDNEKIDKMKELTEFIEFIDEDE